jgi:hypothetical protein
LESALQRFKPFVKKNLQIDQFEFKVGNLILESNNPKSKAKVFEDCAARAAVSNDWIFECIEPEQRTLSRRSIASFIPLPFINPQ